MRFWLKNCLGWSGSFNSRDTYVDTVNITHVETDTQVHRVSLGERLVLLGVFIAFLWFPLGCLRLPPAMPEIAINTMASKRYHELETLWHQKGFINPAFFELKSAHISIQKDAFLLDNITFLVPRRMGWTIKSIADYTRHLPLRLGECSIAINAIIVVFFDLTMPVDDIDLISLVERVPEKNHPIFFFSHSTGYTKHSLPSGGYTLFHGNGRSFAVISRYSPKGRKYEPEQTIAHELGHMAGLTHTPKKDELGKPNVDLMQPRGCLYCSFTPGQCQSLQNYALFLDR